MLTFYIQYHLSLFSKLIMHEYFVSFLEHVYMLRNVFNHSRNKYLFVGQVRGYTGKINGIKFSIGSTYTKKRTNAQYNYDY